MWPYFIINCSIAAAAILLPQPKPNRVVWVMAFVVLVLFVGLRHKVGMDWNNYLVMIQNASNGTMVESFDFAEPAFAALLWISARLGAGVYGANMVVSLILLAGIFRFAKSTPSPWVAVTVAMPVLIVVVGMSANRQAAAIGILLWLASGWSTSSLKRRILLTLMAASFHFSAIFFLMFAAMGLKLRAEYKLIIGMVMAVAMIAFLQYSGGAEYYDQLYLSGQSELTYSSGATQHVLLNGIPAMAVLLGKRIRSILLPSPLLVQMAWLSLLLIPTAFVFSTASGRMTLYLFPVSMYVLAKLPNMFGNPALRAAIRTTIGAIMVMILWIWLQYANSSVAHIPYNNALLMDEEQLHLCCY